MIADRVKVGMAEEEAKEVARTILTSLGMRRGWHHIIVRCGPNTTKDFMERSEPGVVLEENDIFFVDIGPIFRDSEGDAGDTFVFGDDPDHHRAKRDVRAIWEDVRREWFDQHITGMDLYHFAEKAAARSRVEAEPGPLRPPPLGLPALRPLRRRRWPRWRSARTRISGCSRSPSPTPTATFGAFYEDLLLEDQSFPEGSSLPARRPRHGACRIERRHRPHTRGLSPFRRIDPLRAI